MNSVEFYLFNIKKFIISWVAFMYHLILLGKELLFGGFGEEGGINVQNGGVQK